METQHDTDQRNGGRSGVHATVLGFDLGEDCAAITAELVERSAVEPVPLFELAAFRVLVEDDVARRITDLLAGETELDTDSAPSVPWSASSDEPTPTIFPKVGAQPVRPPGSTDARWLIVDYDTTVKVGRPLMIEGVPVYAELRAIPIVRPIGGRAVVSLESHAVISSGSTGVLEVPDKLEGLQATEENGRVLARRDPPRDLGFEPFPGMLLA